MYLKVELLKETVLGYQGILHGCSKQFLFFHVKSDTTTNFRSVASNSKISVEFRSFLVVVFKEKQVISREKHRSLRSAIVFNFAVVTVNYRHVSKGQKTCPVC